MGGISENLTKVLLLTCLRKEKSQNEEMMDEEEE